MMTVILIRHGEARYDEVEARGYFGMGHELGKLTELGVKQAHEVSFDHRLKGAELIIASPYTRALQTASIISRITQIPLVVENDVHEWMPDLTHKFQIPVWDDLWNDFMGSQGYRKEDSSFNWESLDQIKDRMLKALLPYKDKYQKVIVVTHGIAMSSFSEFNDCTKIKNCEIREIEI